MSTHRSFTRATHLRTTPGQALVVLAGLMLAAALAFTSVPAHSASSAAPDQGFVYTADEHGNSLSMIDLSTGLVTSVEVPFKPHNLQLLLPSIAPIRHIACVAQGASVMIGASERGSGHRDPPFDGQLR